VDVDVTQGEEISVVLEFTPDGNCSIAVRGGASSRAEMSYRPQTPGRCAIPAIREKGPVELTVMLPPGTERPRDTVPAMEWSTRNGRAYGTAHLSSAPEFVDIMPPREHWPASYGWLLIALAAGVFLWAIRRRGNTHHGDSKSPRLGREQ
jgi:hypothetical protein